MNIQSCSTLTLTATTITLFLAVNTSIAASSHSTLLECLDYAIAQCDPKDTDYNDCVDFGVDDCDGSYLKPNIGLTAGQINRGKKMIRSRRSAVIKKWKLQQK